MSDKMVYSYSRLDCFKTCKYSFYLKYIAKRHGKTNVYAYLGGLVHRLLERLQEEEISIQKAIELFKEGVEEAEFLGMNFSTEKSKNTYVESIIHYLSNWKPFNGKTEIEREFLIDIDGIAIKGFIDIMVRNGDIIDVFDYKTSSKFEKKKLPLYGRQLVLYAIAIKELYPEAEIGLIGWHMLKYAKVGKKAEIRAEINPLDDFEPFVQEYVFNDEVVQELITYIKDTVAEIEACDDITDYPPTKDYFYCKNLCDFSDTCEYNNQ